MCLEVGIPWEVRLKKGGEDENILFLKKGKPFYGNGKQVGVL